MMRWNANIFYVILHLEWFIIDSIIVFKYLSMNEQEKNWSFYKETIVFIKQELLYLGLMVYKEGSRWHTYFGYVICFI